MGKGVINILIVEDDLIIAKMHRFGIESLPGTQADTCRNGKEALEFLLGQQAPFLVLLDLNMPEMNGWEFLEACKREGLCEQIKVIIVTSSLYRADREKARQYEQVTGFYSKPLTRSNIGEIVAMARKDDLFRQGVV